MSFETNSTNIQRNYRATNRAIYSAGFRLVTTSKTTASATPISKANPKAEYSDFKCNTKLTGYAKVCRTLESNRTVDDEESPYSYEYEQELARLAHADYETDGDIFFIEKIHLYVTRCSCCMVCDTIRTYWEEISHLKVAVATSNWIFLERYIQVFRLPLDVVDQKDGMNILDFVYDQYEFYKKTFPGYEQEKKLLEFIDFIKKEGGKFHKYKQLN